MDSKTIELLNKLPDIEPDLHDGSYELMREIINAYATITDYSTLDYKDLNCIYSMAVGTWKLNVEKKKLFVADSHLSLEDKNRITKLINHIWDKACLGEYSNKELSKPSIGMFGYDVRIFNSNVDALFCQRFIKMLVDISRMNDDNEIFDSCKKACDSSFKSIRLDEATAMLHCLKPYTFVYLDDSSDNSVACDVIEYMYKSENKTTFLIWKCDDYLNSDYIDCCKRLVKARNKHLLFKNLRIFDLYAREYDLVSGNRYFPTFAEYDPGINEQQYCELLQDEKIVKRQLLDTIFFIFDIDYRSEATCSAIAQKYGNTPQHYNSNATHLAQAIYKATNCPLSQRDDGLGDRYWSILFQGRYTEKGERGDFSWRLRPPLISAIATLNEDGFFNYLVPEETEKMETTINKNTILYGPPGTGKTFNTIIFAVAIVEKKSLQDVQREAVSDYKAVKERYDEYFAKGMIAFTTFHQSYGYEEFIEGIRPVMSEEDNDVGYRIEAGIFKEFCDRASIPSLLTDSDYGLNKDPKVWKVSLGGARENPVRTDCLEKGHIRIGWDDYGPDVSDRLDELPTGKRVLNAFLNVMSIGDIVLSCYSSTEIDAIGVVTGDYEWDDSYSSYRRLRKVKWLVKNIRENIVEINHGSQMTLATVYWIGVSIRDVLSIVEKYQPHPTKTLKANDNNYVFIIDEINRGNISKIFGELITLIEETKRIGTPEAMTVELPYSHCSFGVPDNVYILGTMNTADRSIAIMDTALRRRFSFVEMLPDADVLRKLFNPIVEDNGVSVNVANMLDVINERITFLYDREHTIGHAFFMPLRDKPSVDTLAMIFEKSIIPLLQEYFYEDYAKIQLVLGDDGKNGDKKQFQFISDEDMDANEIFETVQELDSEKKYTINYPAFRRIESYKYISKRL